MDSNSNPESCWSPDRFMVLVNLLIYERHFYQSEPFYLDCSTQAEVNKKLSAEGTRLNMRYKINWLPKPVATHISDLVNGAWLYQELLLILCQVNPESMVRFQIWILNPRSFSLKALTSLLVRWPIICGSLNCSRREGGCLNIFFYLYQEMDDEGVDIKFLPVHILFIRHVS